LLVVGSRVPGFVQSYSERNEGGGRAAAKTVGILKNPESLRAP
jgi:hypothetical protein